MSDDHRQWDEVKETQRRRRDVAALPETMRDAARFSGSEVMWPKSVAHDAIDSEMDGYEWVLITWE